MRDCTSWTSTDSCSTSTVCSPSRGSRSRERSTRSSWIRDHDLPFKLITNTTTHTREALAGTLRDAGFAVEPADIVTAVAATAEYLRAHIPAPACSCFRTATHVRTSRASRSSDRDESADVVVIGGACDDFSYAAVNHIFGLLNGRRHAGRYAPQHVLADGRGACSWTAAPTSPALEEATGIKATICGKPAPAYFEAALEMLGVPAISRRDGRRRRRERCARRASHRHDRRARSHREVPGPPIWNATTARPTT